MFPIHWKVFQYSNMPELFTHLPVDVYWGCFQFLTIKNKATIKIKNKEVGETCGSYFPVIPTLSFLLILSTML